MRHRTIVACILLGIASRAFAQGSSTVSAERNPNTSICFGSPLPGWCDQNYNGGLGYPGWTDNENRANMDPITTPTIDITPANVSRANIHQLLPASQTGAVVFASLQMWFSTPHNTQQPCSAPAGTGGGLGVCQFDGVDYPLAASHLMNGAQDCPYLGPVGSSGDCASSASAAQTRWNRAVADLSDRGFDGVIAATQGGDTTCLQNPAPPDNAFGLGSTFSANQVCARPGSSQYRVGQALRKIITAMQTATNSSGASMSGMKIAWMLDVGAWNFSTQCGNAAWGTDAATQRLWQVRCVQSKLQADFTWVKNNVWNQQQAYTVGGRPVVLVFGDIDSGVFLDSGHADLCAGGACTLLDGTTCTSQSDCWTKIWNQHRAFMTGTLSTNALLLFRDGNGFIHAQSDGAFLWLAFNNTTSPRSGITTATQTDFKGSNNQGCAKLNPNDLNEPTRVECFYHRARLTLDPSSTLFGRLAIGGAYKGFDSRPAQWWYPNNAVLSQLCGQTWLNTLAEPGANDPATGIPFFDSTHLLTALAVNTWDDYEEGTEIQTGIDNCLTPSSLTLSLPSGNTLSWSFTFNSSVASLRTIDHFVLFDSPNPGASDPTLNVVGSPIPTNACTVNGLTVACSAPAPPLAAGTHTLFVKAAGPPSIVNHLSANSISLQILPPTTFSVPSTTYSNYANPTNAYDGSMNTFASAPNAPNGFTGTAWRSFQAPGFTPSAINLKVTSSANVDTHFTSALVSLQYSTDGGSSWSTIYSIQPGPSAILMPVHTDVISLPANTNIANVVVQATLYNGGSDSGLSHDIYEVWIEASH